MSSDLEKLKKESAQDTLSHVRFAWGAADSRGDLIVEIDPMVFFKIMHWIDKENYEVSGLGMIEVDHDRNVLRVVDAVLLKQDNTGASTEIDGHAIGRAMHEFRQRGEYTPNQLKWWWHSHVNMSVFWSGTDEAAMKCLGGGERDDNSWFVATVFNQKREMLSAYVQNRPIKLIHTGIQTKVCQKLDQDTIDSWDNEYEEKVELPSKASPFLGDDDRSELFRQWKERNEERQLAEAEAVDEDDDGGFIEFEEELSEDEFEEAVKEGAIPLDDLFVMHDEGALTDDEFDRLYDLHPGDFIDEDDDVPDTLDRIEAKAMDIAPVPKKRLRTIGRSGGSIIE